MSNLIKLKEMFTYFSSAHKYAIKLLLILLIPNIVILALIFPGVIHYDFGISLYHWDVGQGVNDDHSLLWQMIAYPFLVLTPSWVFYGILQIGFYIFCILFTINKLIRLNILNQRGGYIFCLVSAFCPTFLFYNVYYDAEIIYGMIAILVIVYLLEIYITKGEFFKLHKNKVIFAILLFFLYEFKQIGMVAIVLIIIVLLIKYQYLWKHILLLILCFAILQTTFILSTDLAFDKDGNDLGRGNSYRMTVVMTQMIARVFWENEVVDTEDKEYFGGDYLAELYVPDDGIDYTVGRPLTPEFLYRFIRFGIDHPKSYIKAYVDATDLYWRLDDNVLPKYEIVNDINLDQCKEQCTNNWYNSLKFFDENRRSNVGWQIVAYAPRMLISVYEVPIISDLFKYIFFNTGVPFCVLLILFVVALYTKKRVLLVVCLPLFGTWLALMLCSPAHWCAMRYAAMMFYQLPIIITLLVNHKKLP